MARSNYYGASTVLRANVYGLVKPRGKSIVKPSFKDIPADVNRKRVTLKQNEEHRR